MISLKFLVEIEIEKKKTKMSLGRAVEVEENKKMNHNSAIGLKYNAINYRYVTAFSCIQLPVTCNFNKQDCQ